MSGDLITIDGTTGDIVTDGPNFDLVINDDYSGNEESRRAYLSDLAFFGATVGFLSDPRGALDYLLKSGQGHANRVAATYRARMIEEGVLSPNTINRRLSSLRKISHLLKHFGEIDFEIEVQGVKTQTYRDTKGPGVEAIRRILEAARKQDRRAKALRDVALIKLMFGLGLRRGEVAKLTFADWDSENGRLWVKGKGKKDKIALTLPPDVTRALEEWARHHGPVAVGPLFPNFRDGRMLSGDGIYDILQQLSAKAGLDRQIRPHGIRHTAITEALDRSNGNVRNVQKFSRHAKMDTVQIYDDSRADIAGSVSAMVSGALGDEE